MATVGGQCHARTMGELTDTERDILAFERLRWKYAGAKETAVLARFGLSMTIYYARLNALIDRPEAEAHEPMIVHRLRRLRDERRRVRSS